MIIKMSRLISIAVIIVTILLIINAKEVVLAWDNEKTHKDLSRIAAEKSVIGLSSVYLDNLGFKYGLDEKFTWNGKILKTKEWIQDGAFYEDAGNWVNAILATARWKNHFHNPLKPWSEAGLTDIQTGKSFFYGFKIPIISRIY